MVTSSTTVSPKPIRWLHLSDIHVGKNPDFQDKFLEHTIENIKSHITAGEVPDLVFLTGDIANTGHSKEYAHFGEAFFEPLIALLGDEILDRIFVIPGNHDVNLANADPLQDRYKAAPFLVPSEEKLKVRERSLLPYFQDYMAAEMNEWIDMGSIWLKSAEAFYAKKINIRGYDIGILAVNTAWMCNASADERGKLSPGEAILEAGLKHEALQDCNLLIVLGHHPINWFIHTDQPKIRTLLGKKQVLYLHGHEHENTVHEEIGDGFLDIQAGAVYQDYEDRLWANRILWCELNPTDAEIALEPLIWSKDHQEWKLDTLAIKNEYWRLPPGKGIVPLPEKRRLQMSSTSAVTPRKTSFPPDAGWIFVDGRFVTKKRRDLAEKGGLGEDEVISYFNGRAPGWFEGLSRDIIPARDMVTELKTQIDKDWNSGTTRVRLLWGPGGEGKTTILYQVMCDLAESRTDWNIIWHQHLEKRLPLTLLDSLEPGKRWLIVSDDAYLIASDIGAALRHSQKNGLDVFFLLSSRQFDWTTAQGDVSIGPSSLIQKTLVSGLTEKDASTIVRHWAKYGDRGMGTLKGRDIDPAAKTFYQASQEKQFLTRYHEGAFLGALLNVRIGEGMRDHVVDMLNHLDIPVLPGITIADILVVIAIFQAKNIFKTNKKTGNMETFVTTEILAVLAGCDVKEVKKRVMNALLGEAAVAVYGSYVFARHTSIARAIVEVISNPAFAVEQRDIQTILVDLIKSVIQHGLDKAVNYRVDDWEYLSATVFHLKVDDPHEQDNNEELGLWLAYELFRWRQNDARYLTKWAELLRDSGNLELAVEKCRTYGNQVYYHRPFYYEWATDEGKLGNPYVSIWLTAVSVADEFYTRHKSPDSRTHFPSSVRITFSGLLAMMREQFLSPDADPRFAQWAAAVAVLGKKPVVSERDIQRTPTHYFDDDLRRAKQKGAVEPPDIETAFQQFHHAVLVADSRLEWTGEYDIPSGAELEFTKLKALLEIS